VHVHQSCDCVLKQRKLSQDPHKVRDRVDRNLEDSIGREVRAIRRQRGMNVSDLASAADLSVGMLSKIENGNISPSLTTLQALTNALNVPLSTLFLRFEDKGEAVLTTSGNGVQIERAGTRAGHQYNLLGHLSANTTGVVVEPYLITLTEESDVFPTFQHDGIETLYMLEGEVDYRHGDRLFRLTPGDTLFFDADAPHGPEVLVELPVRFLSIISYRQSR